MGDRKPQVVFSRRETAEMLGVSLDSVIRAISRGDIKAIRFGRRLLIPRSEIERLLEGAK